MSDRFLVVPEQLFTPQQIVEHGRSKLELYAVVLFARWLPPLVTRAGHSAHYFL